MRWLLVMLRVGPALLAAVAVQAAADPRVDEADALLADRSGYERAASLYREALVTAPEDTRVRRKLARVLSWSERYDESIAEYDALVAASPDDLDLGTERAEMLSWAGRSEEALAGFDAVLAAAPDHARAAAGRARCLRWAGRAAEADRAYARALKLEDDPELREEWAVLRSGYEPRGRGEFEYFEDSDDLVRWSAGAHASVFLDLDTRLTLRAGYLQVEHAYPGAPPGLPAEDHAPEAAALLRHVFDERWAGELELGVRHWNEAGVEPLVGARLEYTSARVGAVALGVDHRGALDRTASLAAQEAGIDDTSLRTTWWRGYPHGLESFVELQTGFLSDSNLRIGTGANLTWKPWEERPLHLHLSASYLGYTRKSDLYYDPSADVSALLSATWRRPLVGSLVFDVDAGGGFGHARQDGVTGTGPSYRAAAGLSWQIGLLRFGLHGSHARSQRREVYYASRAMATIGLDLGR
jgi:hypothetical protein